MCGSCAARDRSNQEPYNCIGVKCASEYHPVGRSHWTVTAENTLTELSLNPTMEFSPAGPRGGDFLFHTCVQ